MGSFSIFEVLILAILPLLVLLVAAFWLALAAFIKVRRLERTLGVRGLPTPRT